MNQTVFKTTAKRSERTNYQLEVPAGTFLFREGDLGTEMYIIQEGQVEILQGAEGGARCLAVLEKGDFFGEMALLEDLPRAASARTSTDSRLLRIDGSTFDQMLRDNPEIAVRMMRKLSRRLRDTGMALERAVSAGTAAAVPELPVPELPPPEAALGTERVIHEATGIEFRLSASSETTLGRKDPVTGIYPDIDLAPVDTQRSVSRRHGKVLRRGDRFFLTEEIGTMNGTFRNQTRLQTGVPAEIFSGDEIRIGTVPLRFRVE